MSKLERQYRQRNRKILRANKEWLEGETTTVNGTIYPKWAVDKAKEHQARTGDFELESWIYTVLVFHEALENATPADPNEPIRAITRGRN